MSLTAENVGPSWSGYSGPNWGSVLTGVTPGIHGITANFDGVHNIDDNNFGAGDIRSLFGHAKQHDANIETAMLNSWFGIGVGGSTIMEHSTSVLDVKIAAGEVVEPADVTGDASIRDHTVDMLLGQGDFLGTGIDPDLTFVHLDQVDSAGHAHRYDSATYRTAIETVDSLVGDVVNAVNQRPTIGDEDWLFIVLSDHGGSGTGHGNNSDPLVRTIPFIVSGSAAKQGIDLGRARVWDVAPTALAHLGVDVGALSLTGDVVGLVPQFPSNASFDSVLDQDVLNIDFGTVTQSQLIPPMDFTLTNLLAQGITAGLELTNVTGTGDTGALSSDLVAFANLAAGATRDYEATLNTSVPGNLSASYDLEFTDEFGTSQSLTLNMSAVVQEFNDPAIPDLIYDPATGEVVVDWQGNTLISYVLKNDTNSFIPGAHNNILLGSFPTKTSNELSESTSFAQPGVTTRSMGNVFPTGLDLAGLQGLLTVNSIVLTLGGPQLPFDLVVLGPAVPEPATWGLALIGLLGLGLLRRPGREI